jgi:hypothetical protein
LQKYADGFTSGTLTVSEVASSVIDLLAESPDRIKLWASAPATLRQSIPVYLAEIGASNVPQSFRFGPGESDPALNADHISLRQEIAAWLVAAAESS